jgi:hypothetical protein
MMRRGSVVAVVIGALAAVGCGGSDPGAAASGGGRELWLRFDRSSGSALDLGNSGSAKIDAEVSAVGTSITSVRRKQGRALRLPGFSDTPTAAVVAVRATGTNDLLAPGSRDFVVGATFRLDRTSQGSAYDNGDNLIQRGGYDGPQYKVQLDDRRPSCRVAGSRGAVFVAASVRATPRYWHQVRCRRVGDRVTLELVTFHDGSSTRRRWSRSGPIGRLDHDAGTVLTIGGKAHGDGSVNATDSDQFNGRVDNALFRLL